MVVYEKPNGGIDGDIINIVRTNPGKKCRNAMHIAHSDRWDHLKLTFYKQMIKGEYKELPEDVPIYNHMMKLNQDTNFGYFIGENVSSLSKKEF